MNTLTVVTVNYNSRDYLERCVESVYRETSGPALRLVVVDNASEDRDFRSLQSAYPSLDLIQNEHNLGFATACNQGIRHRPAEFYLLLNPDCEVLDGAVDKCLAFLATRPEIGIVGCRVQNPDGSLQLACRRSIPRPSVALYRLTGLSRLFPRSPRFAAYNLSYLDERAAHEVGAVSGSFLMCRDQVVHDIGGLDEAFFLYGEDLDFCYRALLRGWKVYYNPDASVMHHKRRSSTRDVGPSLFHYYDAMEIFYNKHYAAGSGALQNAVVVGSIRCLRTFYQLRRVLLGGSEVGSHR